MSLFIHELVVLQDQWKPAKLQLNQNSFIEEHSYIFIPTSFQTTLDFHIIPHIFLISMSKFTLKVIVLLMFTAFIFIWLLDRLDQVLPYLIYELIMLNSKRSTSFLCLV